MVARTRFKLPVKLPLLICRCSLTSSSEATRRMRCGFRFPLPAPKGKGCRLGILFLFSSFLTHTRLSSTYNDSGDGIPAPLLHFRRHTMNNCLCNVFDNNNWIWIILIVLLFSCCGGCCSLPRSLLPPDRGELFFQRSDAFFHFVSEKMRKMVAFFGKMWYNRYDFRKITAFPT